MAQRVSNRRVPTELPLSRNSITWRINAEPVVFAGGGRALLLQVAHPSVGAGVEQHSSYASDPWGRLMRTVDTMMKLGFGSPEVSARQERMLRKMHERVTGTTEEGDPYHALDPALLLWVWATLVETALTMYERTYGRLPRPERERFYAESLLVAYGCGVPPEVCPPDVDSFLAYVDRVIAEDLRVTDGARAVAVASSRIPIPGPAGRVLSAPHELVTAGMLPPALREDFGFTWSASKQRRLNAFFTTARLGGAVTPASLRQIPATVTLKQKRIPKVAWLRRQGATFMEKSLSDAGFDTSGQASVRKARRAATRS